MLRNPALRVTVGFAGVITGWIFFTDNFYDITRITGASMSPSLSPKWHETRQSDWLLWRLHSLRGTLHRGDVVRFYSPYHPDKEAVKRVVALPGDTVVLDKKRRPVRERDGADMPESQAWDRWGGRVRVPEGHVWVEGDNWRKSRDSNTYGPVSMGLVNGKAVQVVLPAKDFGSRPWEVYESRTKVVPGRVVKREDEELLDRIFQG